MFTYEDFYDEVKKKKAIIKALNRMADSGKVAKLSKNILQIRKKTIWGIAYEMYKNIIELRPEWNEVRAAAPDEELTESELLEIKSIKMIITRNKDDEKKLSVMSCK